MRNQTGVIVDGVKVMLTDLLVYSRAGSIWKGNILKNNQVVYSAFILEQDKSKQSKWVLFDTLELAKEIMEFLAMEKTCVDKS